MILLDTQVLIWWTLKSDQLSEHHRKLIDSEEHSGIAASAFSVWEVGMLVSKNRLKLSEPAQVWLDRVLAIPTVRVLEVTPQILLDSTQLPDDFHGDPADRIIVSTARAHRLALLTTDAKILTYKHVHSVGPRP